MNIQTPKLMTVDEYLIWAERHPGRYELINGVVRQMAPETSDHAEAKRVAGVGTSLAQRLSGHLVVVAPDRTRLRPLPSAIT